MPPLKDLTGQKFGRLTVVEQAGRKNGHVFWYCKCECGKETVVAGNHLRRGAIKSCGCLRRELAQQHMSTLRAPFSDGRKKERLYRIWHGMKDRCSNLNYHAYKQYGGRGIQVCEEWNDYAAFRAWAFANGYRDDLSIDRVDVNGNYEPDNCRWVDAKTQNRNTRKNHYLAHNGETLTLAEWAEQMGVTCATLSSRLRRGWSVERALTEPVKKQIHKEEPK